MNGNRPIPPAEGMRLRAGAAPFFASGGPTGVLLIHGYSGSPAELRPMGYALSLAGYSVHGPLLAGHGGKPADMHGARWQDWLASAEAGLRRLREQCETVFVAGFSMGALLALHLAAHQPIAGLIALAPALRLRGGWQLRFTGLLKHILPWYYPLRWARLTDPALRKSVREWVPDANLDDPAVVARIRREARISVSSLYELVRLQDHVRRELPRVMVPTLLMQGRRDRTVDIRSIGEITRAISSVDQQVRWYERSGHLLADEIEREAVWEDVARWIKGRARVSIAD